MYEDPRTPGQLQSAIRSNPLHTLRLNAAICSLLDAMWAKDPDTAIHMRRLATIAIELGRQLKLPQPELTALYQGALLHDIGKLSIDTQILRKPGPLTPAERRTICLHPLIGQQIIQPLQFAGSVLEIIRHHHERWDGQGYPDGLAGTATPLSARIVAVADAYDAMTSQRPYNQPLTQPQARERLATGAGISWDPHIIAVFLAWHKAAFMPRLYQAPLQRPGHTYRYAHNQER